MKLIKELKRPLAIALISIAIMASRRYEQLIKPAIWVEDGTFHISEYMREGPISIFYPTQGYSQPIGRIITSVSIELFGSYYAIGSTLITLIIFGMICWIIARQKSYLPAIWSIPIIYSCVPIDPEMALLPSYLFWYTGCLGLTLPFLISRKISKNDTIIMPIISAASPLSALAIPPLLAKTVIQWRKSSRLKMITITLLLFIACSTTTVLLPKIFNGIGGGSTPITAINLPEMIEVLISKTSLYLNRTLFFESGLESQTSNVTKIILIGGYFLGAIKLYQHFKINSRLCLFGVGIFLLIGNILINIVRLGPAIQIIDPVGAGPRYFFYSSIMLTYILFIGFAKLIESLSNLIFNKKKKKGSKYLLIKNPAIISSLLVIAVPIYALNYVASKSIARWQRYYKHHNYFSAASFRSCALANESKYTIQIAFTGDESNPWHLEMTSEDCKILENKPFPRLINYLKYELQRSSPIFVLNPSISEKPLRTTFSSRSKKIFKHKEILKPSKTSKLILYYRGGGNPHNQVIEIKTLNQSTNCDYLNNSTIVLPKSGETWLEIDLKSILAPGCKNIPLLIEVRDQSSEIWHWSEVATPSNFTSEN